MSVNLNIVFEITLRISPIYVADKLHYVIYGSKFSFIYVKYNFAIYETKPYLS